MTARLYLGQLCVESKSTGLELLLSNSANYTASEKDDLEDFPQQLTASALNLPKQRPWFQSGGAILFRISLQFDACLTSAEQDVLIETFSTHLQLASLWQQLHFSQPSVRTTSADQEQTTIEVTLTHTTEQQPQSCARLHKLDLDVPFYDVKPPPCVPTATLDAIELDIKLHAGSRQHTDLSAKGHMVAGETSWHEWYDDDTEGSDCDMLLETESYHEEHFLSQSLEPSSAFPDSVVGSSTNIELPHVTLRTCEVLNLLDASVRRTISGSLGRLPDGLVMKCNRSFKTLSKVTPALFRAGHLPAVASRAVFLPTISRSLASVQSNRTGTQAHKMTKLSRLQSQLERSVSIKDGASRDDMEDLSNRMAKKLWSTIDQGLLHSMSEPRLKPLSIDTADSPDLLFDHELFEFDEKEHIVPRPPLVGRIDHGISEFCSQKDFCSDSDDSFNDLDKYDDYEDDGEIYNEDEFLSVGKSGGGLEDLLDKVAQEAHSNLHRNGTWFGVLDDSTEDNYMLGDGILMFDEDARSMCQSIGAVSMLDDYADACSSSVGGMEDQEMLLT